MLHTMARSWYNFSKHLHFVWIFAHLIIERGLTQNIILMDILFGPYANTIQYNHAKQTQLYPRLATPVLCVTVTVTVHSRCLLFPPLSLSLAPIHSKHCCDSNEMCSWQSWANKKSNHFSWFQAHAHRKALDMTWWNISIHVQMKCYSQQCNVVSHTTAECNGFFLLLPILFSILSTVLVAVLLWMTHTSSKFCTMLSALMQMTIDGIRVVRSHQRTEKLWTKWQI